MSHRGFIEEAAKHWEWVRPGTACGEALRTLQRVVIPDVQHCDFIAGTGELEVFLSVGIRAVQTTPLVSRSGGLLGMFSTHWRNPHNLSSRELHALDVLGQISVDLIERNHTEQALRQALAMTV